MNEELLLSPTRHESARTILVRKQLLQSFRDREYRREFVSERVRASIALQIRALREQRDRMTQTELGERLGKAQAWVSKLEDPSYGKVTVGTLLQVADAFDVDLEIKFRPFSKMLDEVSRQDASYYSMPSFDLEFGEPEISAEESTKFENALSAVMPPRQYAGQAIQGELQTRYGLKRQL